MLLGRHINKYYGKYWYLFIIGILALAAVDWIQLYLPEYLGQIIDLVTVDYVAGEILDDILHISLYVLLIAVGLTVGRITWRLTIFAASTRIEAGLRKEMFDKATRLSRDYYAENKVGTVMAWFTSDTETIEEYFSWGTVMLIDAIFLSVLTISKMLILNVVMTLITILPLVLIIIWGALVEKGMSKIWKERQEAFDKLYDHSEENFTGIRVIKAFVKERHELRAFAKVAKNNQNVNIKFARVSVLFDVIISILLGAIFALLMGFGGYCVYLTVNNLPLEIFNQSIPMNIKPSTLVTFVSYFDIIIWPMIALGQIVTMKARAKASLQRISRFLDAPEDIVNPIDAVVLNDVKGKITFKNFSFKFADGNEDALSDISLEINPGEKVGIVGRIGSGKTTIANVLCRIFNIQENAVFIDDVDIMKADLVSLRNAIAYVPQDNFLFSDTIKNNISFSDISIDEEKMKEAARFADIDKDIEGFPKGYETVSGERGVTLSGGQKQRISIARAYLKDAPILIMDDSVSAVDVSTEEKILKNINEQRKGKTTLVVASRVSTVAHFDKIIVLNEGKLEAYDSPANLLKISPTYKRMVASQELEKEVKGGN